MPGRKNAYFTKNEAKQDILFCRCFIQKLILPVPLTIGPISQAVPLSTLGLLKWQVHVVAL